MADATATFAVNLEDNTSGASQSAASSLQRLKLSIEDDTKSLAALEAAMRRFKAAAASTSSDSVNIEQFRALQSKIDATKQSIASAQGSYLAMGGNLVDIGKKAKLAEGSVAPVAKKLLDVGSQAKATEAKLIPLGKQVRELGEAAGRVGGPAGLGKLGPSISALGTLLENPYLAVAAFVAILGIAVVALGVFGVAMADASRSNQLYLNAVAGSVEGGKELAGVIQDVSQSVPLAKDNIQKLGVTLDQAGLKNKDLATGLRATATAAGVLGDAAGEKLKSILEKSATSTTGHFKAAADDFKNSGIELDDVARALSTNLGVSFERAKTAIKGGSVSMADGTKALDAAVANKLGASADKLNISLKSIGERAKANFAGLFDNINIERLLQGLSDLVDLFSASTAEGQALRELLGDLLQPLVDSVSGQGGDILDFFDSMIFGALTFKGWILDAETAFFNFLNDPIGSINRLVEKFKKLGEDAMKGLVEGIRDGKGDVVSATADVFTSMLSTGDKIVKRHSPALELRMRGWDVTRGLALGIEDETPLVKRAMVRMLGPVVAPVSAPNVRANRGGADATAETQQAPLVLEHLARNGPIPAEDEKARFTNWLAEALEAARQSIGGAGMSVVNPIDNSDNYDKITLAGLKSPGKCKVTGAGSPRDWDVAKGKGTDGASVSFNGTGLADFTVRIYLTTPKDFDDWEKTSVRSFDHLGQGTTPSAYDIEHPVLNDPVLAIKSVVLLDVLQLQEEGDQGLYYRDLKFRAYRKAKPVDTSVIKGSKSAEETPEKAQKPKRPGQLLIEQKLAEIHKKEGDLKHAQNKFFGGGT